MATEILPGLFVGTREDAEGLGAVVPSDWTCLAVTEYRAHYGKREELPKEPRGAIDLAFMKSGKADRAVLDQVAEQIWRGLGAGKKVLVHCVHAHERSPLAIAWYLVWSGYVGSIGEAYAMIAKLHPSVERRDHWLVEHPKVRHDVIAELHRARARANRSCPCVYVTPCHDRCTCVVPTSSSGCRRCCSYGSLEQRREMAHRLASLEEQNEQLHSEIAQLREGMSVEP